jgi:hypothetical protein
MCFAPFWFNEQSRLTRAPDPIYSMPLLQSERRTPPPSATREHLLVSLLHKRAIAHNMGAEDLEYMLRQQILWSCPRLGQSIFIGAVLKRRAFASH